ncbi:MAG: helix-turn-helix domain-containing protein [Egibacteraceae bacterium]
MPHPAEPTRDLDHVGSGDYARRFGRMLRRERRARGRSRRELAAASGQTVSARDLAAYERGTVRLDVADVEYLTDLYGLDLADVERGRQVVVIDLDAGQLNVAGEVVALPADADPGTALQRYVGVVNRLRSRPMRTPATLRTDDARALAEAFELDSEELIELLTEALGEHAAQRRRLQAVRGGGGSLAVVVVLGVAGATLGERGQAEVDEALAPAAARAAPEGLDAEDATALPEPEPLADPATRFGPDLDPREAHEPAAAPSAAPSPQAEATPEPAPAPEPSPSPSTDPGEEAFVDETNIDAPGGPVVIEAEEGEEAETTEGEASDGGDDATPGEEAFVDETNIDAPGGPVVIEAEEP